MNFVEMLIPVSVCVVLPVMIVWLVMRARQNETNRKAEIMLKAIENGQMVDPDYFKSSPKKAKTIKQELLEKLNGACITTFMGVVFLLLFIVDAYGPGLPSAIILKELLPVAGGVMLAVGIGLFITYFAGKKMLAKEIEAEENNLQQ